MMMPPKSDMIMPLKSDMMMKMSPKQSEMMMPPQMPKMPMTSWGSQKMAPMEMTMPAEMQPR